MDPITIITTVGTGLLAILGPIFGKKYKDIKKKLQLMIMVFNKLDEFIEDGKIDTEEAKEIVEFYRENVKKIL